MIPPGSDSGLRVSEKNKYTALLVFVSVYVSNVTKILPILSFSINVHLISLKKDLFIFI
jgi:hypothetical protein